MIAPRLAPQSASLTRYPTIGDWLDFSETGVVRARSGRVELGQGITIALRAVVAQALSLDVRRVQLVSGETSAGIDESYTAGSMSVELSVQALRAAALAARRHILSVAAGAEAGTCVLQDGQILSDGESIGLDLWSVAVRAGLAQAKVAELCGALPARAPEETALREAGRAHMRARLTGGLFIQDIVLPGMVHAKVLFLPHPAARLAGLNESAILALPGVCDLHRDGSFVAVLADEEAQAMSAVAQADAAAAWDIPETGCQSDAELLAFAGAAELIADTGNPAAAGNRKVVAGIDRPLLAHASIGTCCALAEYKSGRLTVWSHTQGPFQLCAGLAEGLGLPEDRIEVLHRPGAGCYGHNGADDVAFEAALLACARPGRPVRLAWRRNDEMTRGPLAPPMHTRAEITLGEDGRIAALTLDIHSGPHLRRPGPGRPSFAAGPLLQIPVPSPAAVEPPLAVGGGADRNAVPLYDTGALRVTRRVAYDMPLRSSALRSLGAHVNVAAIELAMDAAADSAGIDPVRFRLDHLADARARAVIEEAVAMSGFTPETDEETAMGLGFARYKNRAGYCAAVLEVRATEVLAVPRMWIVADVGEAIDVDGVLAQVEGGAIQSLSWSLKEEVRLANGAADVTEWEDYPILRFSEVPDIAVRLTGPQDAPPLGAGEIAQGPVAGALACAVRRIFGLTHLRLPLTPDSIARMLAEGHDDCENRLGTSAGD